MLDDASAETRKVPFNLERSTADCWKRKGKIVYVCKDEPRLSISAAHSLLSLKFPFPNPHQRATSNNLTHSSHILVNRQNLA